MKLALTDGGHAGLLWIFSGAILCAGIVFLHVRYDAPITQAHTAAQILSDDTDKDMHIVHEAAYLRAVQKRASDDLAYVGREASMSSATASLLDMLQTSAAAHHASIRAVHPEDDHKPPAIPQLQSIPFTAVVRGRFTDLVHVIEDLSHHALLVRVRSAELAVTHAAGASDAPLEATVHAVFYRLRIPPRMEKAVAVGK